MLPKRDRVLLQEIDHILTAPPDAVPTRDSLRGAIADARADLSGARATLDSASRAVTGDVDANRGAAAELADAKTLAIDELVWIERQTRHAWLDLKPSAWSALPERERADRQARVDALFQHTPSSIARMNDRETLTFLKAQAQRFGSAPDDVQAIAGDFQGHVTRYEAAYRAKVEEARDDKPLRDALIQARDAAARHLRVMRLLLEAALIQSDSPLTLRDLLARPPRRSSTPSPSPAAAAPSAPEGDPSA